MKSNSLRVALILLLALTLLAPTFAQEPAARPLIISVGQTVRLQLSTKQRIRSAHNENDQVARLSAVADDPTVVLVTGLMPGRTRITLTGEDGKKEVLRIGPK